MSVLDEIAALHGGMHVIEQRREAHPRVRQGGFKHARMSAWILIERSKFSEEAFVFLADGALHPDLVARYMRLYPNPRGIGQPKCALADVLIVVAALC